MGEQGWGQELGTGGEKLLEIAALQTPESQLSIFSQQIGVKPSPAKTVSHLAHIKGSSLLLLLVIAAAQGTGVRTVDLKATILPVTQFTIIMILHDSKWNMLSSVLIYLKEMAFLKRS